MGLNTQPDNINLLSPVGFRFAIKKLPNVNWFVQAAELPGVTLGEAPHVMPNIDRVLPGEKLTYDAFNLTFKIDEDLQNWMEIQNWLVGLGAPKDSEQFRELVGDPAITSDGPVKRVPTRMGTISDAYMSDASLIILNSNMNANFEINFVDMFPTSISAINFDSSMSDVEFVTASVTFRYLRYDYKKITT